MGLLNWAVCVGPQLSSLSVVHHQWATLQMHGRVLRVSQTTYALSLKPPALLRTHSLSDLLCCAVLSRTVVLLRVTVLLLARRHS